MCNGLVIDMLCSCDSFFFFLIWTTIGKMRSWIVLHFFCILCVARIWNARAYTRHHIALTNLWVSVCVVEKVVFSEWALGKEMEFDSLWNAQRLIPWGFCNGVNHQFLQRNQREENRTFMQWNKVGIHSFRWPMKWILLVFFQTLSSRRRQYISWID